MKVCDLSPLDKKIQSLNKVGPVLDAKFAAAGLNTIRDLLFYLPRRYGTIDNCQALSEVEAGQMARLRGMVIKKSCLRPPRRRPIYELQIEDRGGKLTARWFNFRPFVFDGLQAGSEVILTGKVDYFKGRYQMVHPEVFRPAADSEGVEGDTNLVAYRELEGIPQNRLRKIILQALPLCGSISDPLPEELRQYRKMPPLAECIQCLHNPPPGVDLDLLNKHQSGWQQRLVYDEFLALQLGLFKRKGRQKEQGAPVIGRGAAMAEPLAKVLFPFELTAAQLNAAREILDDMALAKPMNRLVHGDVGSGKTAVALLVASVALKAGYQVALMAPTELLAQQHYAKAKEALGELAPVELLLGHQKGAYKKRVQTAAATGQAGLLIGTHSLIQEAVQFKKLGLVIIDEQHRFGVMQRAALINKAVAAGGLTPHMLVMTATPIPRTMAMTVYGDLDVSTIDQLPPGRQPVVTKLLKEADRPAMYAEMAAAMAKGQQAYMIYPLVEESESELLAGIKNATSMAAELQAGPFKNFRVGLMHGRLDAEEKNRVMEAFHNHDLDLLISTTVVEVGIDVPQATILVVEQAERFGLSQLHQLRGRVGRGKDGGTCILMLGGGAADEAYARMMVLCRESSGFKVAEADLEIRGPGDIIGTRQSGMPSLKYGDLIRDQQILKAARQDAMKIINYDPDFVRFPGLKKMMEELWQDHLFLATVG